MLNRRIARFLAVLLTLLAVHGCTPGSDESESSSSTTETSRTEVTTTSSPTTETDEVTSSTEPETTTVETTEQESEPETDAATESETETDESALTLIEGELDQENQQTPITWLSSSLWTDHTTMINQTPTTYHYPFEQDEGGFIMVQSSHMPGLEGSDADPTEILQQFQDEIASVEGIVVSERSQISGSAGNELLTIYYTQATEGVVLDAYGRVFLAGEYMVAFIGYVQDALTAEFTALVDEVYDSIEVQATDVSTDPSTGGETDVPQLPPYTLDTRFSLAHLSWLGDPSWYATENDSFADPLLYVYPFGNTSDGMLMFSIVDARALDASSAEILEQFYEELTVDSMILDTEHIAQTGGPGEELLTFRYRQTINDSDYYAYAKATVRDGYLVYLSGLLMNGSDPAWEQLVDEVFDTTTNNSETGPA